MLLSIPFLVLLSAASILLGGAFFSKFSVKLIAGFCMSLATFFTVTLYIMFHEYGIQTKVSTFDVSTAAVYFFDYALVLDYLSATLLMVVLVVSMLVHFYSFEYMDGDPHFFRFVGYLSLFTFFMVILVLASNFFQFFIGWEGVGLCSYLLVSFWFTRTQANLASLKAFAVNRVGDAGFLISLLSLAVCYQSLDILNGFYSNVSFESTVSISLYLNVYNPSFEQIFCLGLLAGAMSKSAQIFLHTWLPDAMEGPTPVSALIHAATMVAAGVFLLARCSFSFSKTLDIANVVLAVGSVTAIFAASVGFFQNDIKKIIAYSTCSQLGYMVAAAGAGLFSFSVFHLCCHAFFKALLFLASGAIIHSLNDAQDIRRYGSLLVSIPYSYCLFLVGSLALLGFPFLSGFYSKDAIIENMLALLASTPYVFYVYLLECAACLTALYSIRLLYLAFVSGNHINKPPVDQNEFISEAGLVILTVLSILTILSLFFGWLSFRLYQASAGFLFGTSVEVVFISSWLYSEYLSYFSKQVILVAILVGIYLAMLVVLPFDLAFKKLLPIFGKNTIALKLFYFFSKKWFYDVIYAKFIADNFVDFSYLVIYKGTELGLLEFNVSFVTNFILNAISALVSRATSRLFRHYVSLASFSLIFILFYFVFFESYRPCIVAALSFGIVFIDLTFAFLFKQYNNVRYVPVFHKRRLIVLQRKFWRAFALFIYYFIPLSIVLHAALMTTLHFAHFAKHGRFVSDWLLSS